MEIVEERPSFATYEEPGVNSYPFPLVTIGTWSRVNTSGAAARLPEKSRWMPDCFERRKSMTGYGM